MVSAETKAVIDRAKQIYANQLQNDLNPSTWIVLLPIESGLQPHFQCKAGL